MKELTIEQKAKAYDKALERAKAMIKVAANQDEAIGFTNTIFPELKENEDEGIRKALINGFNKLDKSAVWYNGITNGQILAWLEKQGEDKVEPKFHVGDKVKRKDNPHLTYILKRLTDDGNYEFHAIGKDGHEGCTCFAGVKYQDDWELVEQKPQRIVSAEAKEAMYDKPAWSEEDERHLDTITSLLDDRKKEQSDWGVEVLNEEINWLKSLKERLQPQSRQKWGEEDENILKDIITDVKFEGYNNDMQANSYRKINWLKSLKDRCLPQSQQKWSEEDETRLMNAVIMLKEGASFHFNKKDITKAVD